jgi:hypothetical protein
MKQEITTEQVFQLSKEQMNNIRKVLPCFNGDTMEMKMVLVDPQVDYLREVPQGDLEMHLLIPIDEIFPILNIGQCLEIIQNLSHEVPEYTYIDCKYEVTLFTYGDMCSYEPQEELIDALWEVIKDISETIKEE